MSPDLEETVLQQFDRLVARGELMWKAHKEIEYGQEPFSVYDIAFTRTPDMTTRLTLRKINFRNSPCLASKPYNPNDTSRKPAFVDGDPDFVVCNVDPKHKLIMNKYCWLRPQLLLHTREFESQLDLLTRADLAAGWDVLQRLGPKYMVMFNGGPDAGSSVAHKHLQIVPKPLGWKMFPEVALDRDPSTTSMDDVPYLHLFQPLGPVTDSARIHELYVKMCKDLSIHDKYRAHNIILTHSWLVVIPTRKGIVDGVCKGGANAMMGWIWVMSEDTIDKWRELGPMKVLSAIGIDSEKAAGVKE